jgi:hypothetical protein
MMFSIIGLPRTEVVASRAEITIVAITTELDV